MALNTELLDILACPKCKGDLEYQPEPKQLICHTCRLKFNIQDDIPDMLLEDAESF